MKKILLILLITSIFILQTNHLALASIDNSDGLYRISLDGKYGFVNRAGDIVVEPQYSNAYDFGEGRAAVCLNGKWGFIDTTGKVVVKLQYDNGSHFYTEGLTAVQKGSDAVGFIDKDGNYVIEPKFDAKTLDYSKINYFNNGVAWVYYDGGIFLINRKGEFISKQYMFVDQFIEGIAVVVNSKLQHGYVDLTGREIITPKYSAASEFSEGLAAVVLEGDKYGFIDKTGKVIIEPQYDYQPSDFLAPPRGTFKEELALVTLKGKQVFIDKSGKVAIYPQFNATNDSNLEFNNFSEGLARVFIDKHFGFMNKNGEIVIKPIYYSASDFSEGLAEVGINGNHGFIDKTGKGIIEPRRYYSSGFRGGLAVVTMRSGDIWAVSYIDRTGKLLWDPGFLNKPIKVILNGETLYFDADPRLINGRVLVPFRAIGEALGAVVDWDGPNQKAYLTIGDKKIILTVGDRNALVNEKNTALDVPAMTYDDRILIPLRFVSEVLGARVNWDSSTCTVTIVYDN